MPIYQCISPTGLLSETNKTEVAEEIMRIHCDATASLPAFVNVLFIDTAEGQYFTAGKPSTNSAIVGQIRRGRDLATRTALMRALSQMWTRITGQPEGQLLITVWENPAENAIEAGLTLPAPGHEQEWLDQNRETLIELGMLR
jgi:phenylpyruvate tautomerase PptA (4-oxalocrotonate tautomerase family)